MMNSITGSIVRRCLATGLLALWITLGGCVDYEEERSDKGELSTLEEINRRLDEPRLQQRAEPAPEATAEEESGRWKAYGNKRKADPEEQQRLMMAELHKAQAQVPWPPRTGTAFPVMELLTPGGRKFSTDSLRGRMTLIEYVAMGSPASQALAGSNERGPFGRVPFAPGFQSLEKYFPAYSGGVTSREVNLVQILLVDPSSRIVTPAVAQNWVKHFDLEARGRKILIGSPALLQNEGGALLGGFQLLDKNMIVRVDATRERSKTLFSELFPAMGRLAKQ